MDITVVRFASLDATDVEQQLVQRDFEVVVIEIAVADFHGYCNVPNG